MKVAIKHEKLLIIIKLLAMIHNHNLKLYKGIVCAYKTKTFSKIIKALKHYFLITNANFVSTLLRAVWNLITVVYRAG